MKILVQFSGGKDSQACLIKSVKDYGKDKITAVFCDTGWEHEETYKHIDNVVKALGVKLVTIKSKKYKDFVDMAIRKGRFPSTMARFCTSELKVIPMIDYILSQDDSFIIIQGIRAKESTSRAKLDVECSYFKEYFNSEVKGLYHKKEVLEWCKTHDASVLRPIFNWSAQEVIDYILASGQRPNPLYERGFSRVGCFPCIMCRKREMQLISKDEWASQRLILAEQKMKNETKNGSTFFPPTYIPKRFCANGEYPTIAEVFKYVNRNDAQLDLFEPEGGYSCMSLYHGLCE
ncbi:phosphoadenosine phosphosulfate reductase family protein [Hoylesella loescheii]|uniref:Phosphoadenosine phosphosulfate reductase family protein n=1 Tax=Hoylesella loescheii DSM 19665 = JCM 12249 = ATCC 15930 TaxID=1122985 RepID=A0A069QJW6_HOYLO|nr:phosphoadenosine phosphosulfate reductase family protein [Hoylesella loescheii]KDR52344.1 phosphoadenosine phosphosulfate reductase family protein [Hoylesella loescheii DSM 19665 = JCM 12249 = ATCC 15930]